MTGRRRAVRSDFAAALAAASRAPISGRRRRPEHDEDDEDDEDDDEDGAADRPAEDGPRACRRRDGGAGAPRFRSPGARMTPLDLNGVKIWKGFLDAPSQEEMVEDVRAIARAAPFQRYLTPWGKPMTVAMTAAGRLGWVASRRGYAYADRHPEGMAWPPIPDGILSVWRELSGWPDDPDCCLVNFYSEKARMGLHQDRDEGEFVAPVLSISLGDAAVFRVGGTERKSPTRSIPLESGDVAVLGGAARLVHHGVDRIRFGSSRLLPEGGRINLTLRVVRSA